MKTITDKNLALQLVKHDGKALQYLSEELKNNIEVVLEAVKQNGCALKFASEELRGDRDVVLEAVRENGDALEYASKELQEELKNQFYQIYENKRTNRKT